MKRALLLATILASGCAGNVYKVDSRFTNHENAQLQEAADAWAAVGGTPIDLVLEQHVSEIDSGNIVVKTNARAAVQAVRRFEDPTLMAVTTRTPLDGNQILIAMDRLDETKPGAGFRATAIHEFGHIELAGGDEVHVADENAIMFWAPIAENITKSDIDALQARSR